MIHPILPSIPVPVNALAFDSTKISKSAATLPGGTMYQLKPRKQYTIQRKREKWTKEEHRKFMEAIEKFGRNWKKVEEHVHTKSRKQIRSHAQKHFDKLKKMGMNFPPPRAKKKAIHPYPSRKTNELLAMYTKSVQYQQQQVSLQLQHIKREETEAEPNYERIFTFVTSLFNPSKYPNQHELINPLTFVDRKYLRLLMHNLAVMLSREQMQESVPVPSQLPVQTVSLSSIQPMPASLQEEILLMHQQPQAAGANILYPVYNQIFDMPGGQYGQPNYHFLQPYMADIPTFGDSYEEYASDEEYDEEEGSDEVSQVDSDGHYRYNDALNQTIAT